MALLKFVLGIVLQAIETVANTLQIAQFVLEERRRRREKREQADKRLKG